MTIAFYVSGHGFGHASRDVEVINKIDPGTRVLIRSAAQPDLFARTITRSYDLIPGACDTGVVQTTSVAHDDAATVEEAIEFYGAFDTRAAAEVRLVADAGVRLVVGDIAPLAFEVASRIGVPSVAMANFTWDWIYEAHPGFLPRGAATIEIMRAAYRKATLALELPLSPGLAPFPRVRQIPLVARRPSVDRRTTRALLDLPAAAKVALLSFGGYGMPELDLAGLDCRRDWIIVTTDETSPAAGASPAHVRLIPASRLASGLRYENLVAAVDVVITKPGYGIIAECISANTAMLYTSRGHFREYDVLVAAIRRYVRNGFLDQRDLFAGRWRQALEAVRAEGPAPEIIEVNGAEVAAGIVSDMCRAGL